MSSPSFFHTTPVPLSHRHDGLIRRIDTIAKQKDSLITTSTDSITRRFSYPDDEFAGILSRAAAVPARWLSLDAGGERVAICSECVLAVYWCCVDLMEMEGVMES